MPVELTLQWEGRDASDFSRVFDIAADVDDFRPVFKPIADKVIAPSIGSHFEAGGHQPKWASLAQSTINKKSRMGVSNPTKILVHTGALKKAAESSGSYKMSKDELRAAPFGINYYSYHQKGTDSMPQRVVMRLAVQDRTKINTLFAGFIRSFVNFNPATGGRQFTGGGLL